MFLPVLCREPTKKNPRGTLRRGKRSFRGYDEKGTGLGLFSGRWTIFQVSDYVSLPQLERLITARAELVSFIGASARWKGIVISIGRRSISSWISAEEEEDPSSGLSRTDCVSSLSPIARISCQSTRRLVSGFSHCDDSVLLADPSLGPTNHDNSSIVYRISFSCKLIILIVRKIESNLSRS